MTGTKHRSKYRRKRKGNPFSGIQKHAKKQRKHCQKNLKSQSQQRVHHANNHHQVPNVMNR